MKQIFKKNMTNDEKLVILKNSLERYYQENHKLDDRGMSKADYVPSMAAMIKILKNTNNYDEKFNKGENLYNYIKKDIPEEYYIRYYNRNKFTYDEIYHIFEKNNCKLLSDSFDNIDSIVKYKCSCGNISKIKIASFLNGRRCKKCSIERRSNKRKMNFSDIKKFYEDNNCILLSSELEYKNKDSKLTFLCKCGNTYTNSFSSFKLTKECKQCGLNRIKGENHYDWKGGISSLHEYLRERIVDWKKDSAKFYNYKCIVTGEKLDVIHHIYPFEKIVDEVLLTSNIPLFQNISQYSEQELVLLSQLCIEIHNKYGLGVPLKREVHILFHKTYGNRSNTPEQFEDFKTRLKQGEFNNFLLENNLSLII